MGRRVAGLAQIWEITNRVMNPSSRVRQFPKEPQFLSLKMVVETKIGVLGAFVFTSRSLLLSARECVFVC